MRATLQSEGVDTISVVNVLVTNDLGIRKYNRIYRQKDKSTDVLSFPMQVFKHPGWENIKKAEYDETTGELPLGDIIISLEAVKKQAAEYGNTVDYETAYLIIHSTLHLLGYDHTDKKSEKTMHAKAKQILYEMKLLLN